MIATHQEMMDKVVEATKVILSALNGGNRKEIGEAISETIRRDHRTLQQSFWSAMLLAQIDYANNAAFDLRNQEAVSLAVAVKEVAIKMNMDLGLPCV